jgi:hypothetical protein
MISAAVVSSFFPLRMRPFGCDGLSSGSPATSGRTATPVSKPDNPSARCGNRSRATTIILPTLPCSARAIAFQPGNISGCSHRWWSPHPTTNTFSSRYTATIGIARPTASRKPLRKIAPSAARRTSVIRIE